MMRWPFQGKAAPPETFAVGRYKLDGSVEGLGGLIEFSPSENAAMGRQFVGEKNYNAVPVSFLGRPWEVMVQAVHGRICAIAPYLLLANRRDADLSILRRGARQTRGAAGGFLLVAHERRKRDSQDRNNRSRIPHRPVPCLQLDRQFAAAVISGPSFVRAQR